MWPTSPYKTFKPLKVLYFQYILSNLLAYIDRKAVSPINSWFPNKVIVFFLKSPLFSNSNA